MNDINEIRNELKCLSILCLSKGNNLRFNYRRENEFQAWLLKNKNIWDSCVLNYISEEEFKFYLLHPTLIKGNILCENCAKEIPFDRIKKGNKTCCEECRIARMHSPERDAKFLENWKNKSADDLAAIRKKYKTTMIERYGVVHNWCNGILRDKEIETWKEKYGVTSPLAFKAIREQIKNIKKERYGDEFYTNRKKAKDTMIKRYGGYYNNPKKISDSWQNKSRNEIDERTKKTLETNLRKYGTPIPQYSKEGKLKRKNTCLEKYGVEHYSQSNAIKQKKVQTLLKHFGVDVSFKAEEVKLKSRKTVLEKYGVEYIQQSPEFHSKIRKLYKYDGISFDSKYEVYFYIYHKELLKNNISRGKRFSYLYGNKINYYFCDFLLNGKNVEIKGNHLFRDEKLYYPYKNLIDNNEMQNKLDAKSECMWQNNVVVILTESDEMKNIITKVDEIYGKNYVKSFSIR